MRVCRLWVVVDGARRGWYTAPCSSSVQRAMLSSTPARTENKKRRPKRAVVSPGTAAAPTPARPATLSGGGDRLREPLASLIRVGAGTLRHSAGHPSLGSSTPLRHPSDADSDRSPRRAKPPQATASPPRSRRYGSRRVEDLPGGALLNAVVPSPLALMRADKVCADVERFLATQGKSAKPVGGDHGTPSTVSASHHTRPSHVMQVLPVPHSTLKRAVLSFAPTPGSEELVTAIGQARKEKSARKLCLLHAAALIDHFSIHSGANGGDRHPASSLPPPLVSEAVDGGGATAADGRGHASAAAVPVPKQYAHWAAYVKAATAYVEKHAESQRLSTLLRGHIPRSGNPFVDRATARFEARTKPLPGLLVQRLNNAVHNGSRDMCVNQLARDCVVASLPLEPHSRLTATGVARSSKIAKQRCAGHALYILQELQKASLPTSAHGERGDSAEASSVHSAPLPSLVESLKPRQSRLFNLFQRLYMNGAEDAIVFHSRFVKNKSGQFVCSLQLGEVRCEGVGINRFEAERAAVEIALAEMELYDARVQALGLFVSRYPKADANTLHALKLPESLRAHMVEALAKYEIALGLSSVNAGGDATHSATPAVASSSPPSPAASAESLWARQEQPSKETPDNPEAGASASESVAPTPWPRNLTYAAHLRDQLCRLRANPVYLQSFHTRRTTLAIASAREDLLRALEQHRVVVVCGTTGCGKTTQVPQYILDDAIMRGEGDQVRILVTQPRRLTTFGVADRIAKERLEDVGQTVGYAVRLDAKPGRHITLCTSGVLLQMLVSSPSLAHCSHLILDEVHERDINCDVILALVKSLLNTNPHLKVILMSATMQHDMFVNYFRTQKTSSLTTPAILGHTEMETPCSEEVPVIQVEGQVYPVKEMFLEDIAAECRGTSTPAGVPAHASLAPFSSRLFDVLDGRGAKKYLHTPPATDYQLIAHLVHRSVARDMNGDAAGKSVLIFLPGWKELLAAKRAIETYSPHGTSSRGAVRPHVILLHSTVDSAKQKECFLPAPPGTVKVVLATNIAESGITIDDVAVVIDTGLIKLTTWAAVRGGDDGVGQRGRRAADTFSFTSTEASATSSFGTQLSLCYASKANCTQRKGRAGRTQGGVCYRLFTRAIYDAMDAFQKAEIHRVSLAQVLLKLLSLGHLRPRVALKQFLEPPSEANVEVSMALLKSLDAVDAQEALTALGAYLARLPCDPRVGKMIVMGAVLRCLDSVLTVAAAADATPFISSRTVAAEVQRQRYLFARGSQSDHVSALNAYNGYCQQEQQHGGMSEAVQVFATAHYLNPSNLRLISRYKQQYREILHQAGLLASAVMTVDLDGVRDGVRNAGPGRDLHWPRHGELFVDESALSSNATNLAVVKACVCAALFPNVAVLDGAQLSRGRGGVSKTQAQAAKLTLRTRAHPSITPSKESVCRRVGAPRENSRLSKEEYIEGLLPSASDSHSERGSGRDGLHAGPSAFYVFQDVFSVREARKDFLTNVSAIDLWALLLFGAGEANMRYDEKVGICAIDDWIFVEVAPEDYTVLQQLKRLFFAAVWRLYERPDDRQSVAALSGLRALSYAVLNAPLSGKLSVQEAGSSCTGNAASTDTILSPHTCDGGETTAAVQEDAAVAQTAHTSAESEGEAEDEDVFGIFIDDDDD